MNIAKNLIIALVIILGIAGVVIYFLPNSYTVTNSIEIDRPSTLVYGQVANFNKWSAWSPWHEMEPEAKITIVGTPGIEGHKMTWDGKKVGMGHMVLTAYGENESLVCTDFFEKPMTASAKDYWSFENEGSKTIVTWTSAGGLKFPFGRLAGLRMESIVGDPQRKGLANLKKVCEAMELPASPPVATIADSTTAAQ
ncbi:MAG TPA: SRPBCC family protein [Chitinophagales bacterium]|nr:SRPBCC family protein [Chitinophagales bacterium]